MKNPAPAIILASLVATSTSAQTLWNGTTVGMSPDEARSSVHGLSSEIAVLDTEAGFRATGVPVAGHRAGVDFQFVTGRLTKVSVLVSEPARLPNAQVDVIAGLLEREYGEPLACERLTAVNRRCNWVKDGTAIDATIIHGPAGWGFVSIIYTAAPASNL